MTISALPRPLHPRLWVAAAAILLVPAIAMQFSPEVRWGWEDFLAIGALLGTACLAYELASRVARTRPQRVLAATVIGVLALLVWAELAVGILD